MTLFEKIKETISSDCKITFTEFAFNLILKIERVHKDVTYSKESWLPLSDHCYESKIVDCIEFNINEIRKEIAAKKIANEKQSS